MQKLSYKYPQAIVSTDWLASNINSPDVRIFDCTTHLDYNPKSDHPYDVTNGQIGYELGHIPGSSLLDLQGDLSDNKKPYLFAIPDAESLSEAFGQLGIGDDTHVILYARENPQWAARVWWMLYFLGFDKASILDGGMVKWSMENREVVSGNEHYPKASFSPKPRLNVFVDKNAVLKAIYDENTCTISALSPDLHSGKTLRYGRAGRIPGSKNVPAVCLIDRKNTTFLSAQKVSEVFNTAGISSSNNIITYCGSGIWAAMNAFMLYQLGYENISVYDNSMSEWGRDEKLPLEVD